MSIEVSPKIEAHLAAEAERQGLSVEALLEEFLAGRQTGILMQSRSAPELPVWHLGKSRSLDRRDIYDDVG
jgi:hypothetical protein